MSVQKITPTTGVALRKAFQILEDQFDIENGCYRGDYSDDKVAKETGISAEAVKQYRISGFGKIKPPNDVYLIRQELSELETFALKTENELRAKCKELSLRLNALERKFD